MKQEHQKLLFKISVTSILVTTLTNVWMQATTGNVNGSIFGPIALICGSIVVLTIFLVEIFTPGPQKVKGIARNLILLIIIAVVISQVATSIWGFTPTGWVF